MKIDKDYRNYERVIGEMQAREEEMAVTFVEKVRVGRVVENVSQHFQQRWGLRVIFLARKGSLDTLRRKILE